MLDWINFCFNFLFSSVNRTKSTPIMSKIDITRFSGPKEEIACLIQLLKIWADREKHLDVDKLISEMVEKTSGNPLLLTRAFGFLKGNSIAKSLKEALGESSSM